jgi:hypothetical protein
MRGHSSRRAKRCLSPLTRKDRDEDRVEGPGCVRELFAPLQVKGLELSDRFVMAPMTFLLIRSAACVGVARLAIAEAPETKAGGEPIGFKDRPLDKTDAFRVVVPMFSV